MIKEVEIKVTSDRLNDREYLKRAVSKVIKQRIDVTMDFKIIKRSIDARKGRPKFVLRIKVGPKDDLKTNAEQLHISFQKAKGDKVIIVGAGPAGYFAALECLENGLTPIILERGKDVRARRRDLKAIQQDGVVNPNSNYCFGEGGAGTYSDGKLYTRSKKRGKIIKTLKILVDHGAQPEILIDAHPHIGSNKLPGIISSIRETIEKYGGEVRFDSKVVDIIIHEQTCKGVLLENGDEVIGDHVILATGHSARDIFEILYNKGIKIEAKPFALGVRVEHPQPLIDEIQYRHSPREENLPAASYSLVSQVEKVGVFSFCMCPGGLIVPSATAPGEIVVNGMSLSKRDSPYANSGLVTAVSTEELIEHGYTGVFGNMDFQAEVEQFVYSQGDGSQKAPAQNLVDFVSGVDMLPVRPSSYIPGLLAAPLHEILPPFIYGRLKAGIIAFGKKLPGYFTDEANVVAVESRTSSPVRIPRDRESCMHVEIKNLYPCGEGAGYAGGILSAAMDGQRVVQAIYKLIN